MSQDAIEICKNCGRYYDSFIQRGRYRKFCRRACQHEYRRKPSQIKKRFWSYVKRGKPDECWVWMGLTLSTGYGQFSYVRELGKYKDVSAHRFAYRITRGKIPRDLFVCHTCDNPPCCNPNHLFLGSPAANSQDMVGKNRQSRGEDHSSAKLTPSSVRGIHRLRSAGHTYQFIADAFEISKSQVFNICSGKHWQYLD